MAQVDPNIAMGFRPIQIESPVNQMRALAELQGAQQQQQMNALRMQELQRGTEQRNALARIHADPKVKIGSPEYLNRVQTEAPDLYESVAARAQQRAELEEKVEERKYKNFDRKFKLFQSIVPNINSGAGVYQYLQAAYSDPDLKPILEKIQPLEAALESNLAAFEQNPDDWRLRSSGVAPDKLVELAMQKSRAQREEARLDLESQRVEETQRHQQAMEAISKSGVDRQQKQLEETERHNKAMERLRSIEVSKPSAASAPTITMVLDPNDNTRMLSIDAKTYRGGSLGSQGVIGIAGKEPTVGKKQEAKEAAQSNAETTIAQLRQSYDQLDRLGGITSTRNRVGTNIAAGLSSSAAGQFTGRLLGTEAQSERNKIAQTRPLLMTTIMQAMGLSAKQLDSNAELKLWLSAATDPTLDLEANRDALNNLERMLTGKGKGAGAGTTPPAAPKPKSDVRSRADAILGQ